jgi:hypothetical protein
LGVVHAISISIALDIAEVAYVADGAVRAAMVVAEWVIVLASSDTSLSKVPELVNMESMKVVHCEPSEMTLDMRGRELAFLLKLDNAICARATIRVEDADCTSGLGSTIKLAGLGLHQLLLHLIEGSRDSDCGRIVLSRH